MKIPAFILLFVFSTYLIETIKIPSNCVALKTKTVCQKSLMKNVVCPLSKNSSGKNNSTNTSKCNNCIVFFLWVPHSLNENNSTLTFITNNHSYFIANPLASYSKKQWKPPNIIALS